MFVMVPRAAASAERIQQVLETSRTRCATRTSRQDDQPRLGEWSSSATWSSATPAPRIRSCAASRFTARPGQTTAIVGSTGSGKSTLINLIPRFYDVTSGSVPVDGVDVRQLRQEDLWRLIGVVPQKAFLFSGTVASNLRYGDEAADDEALWQRPRDRPGARTSCARWRAGWSTRSTRAATNVSGGQRQRLAIARAMVKKPKVYIFDDSFSALDFKTDQQLRAALRAETTEATVIIVAQRVGTIMHADQIVVLEGGDVAGIGHARPADGDVRDLPRDRALAADPGGSGMSGPRAAAGGGGAGPGPGGWPGLRTRPVTRLMMPTEKARDFRGTAAPLPGRPGAGAVPDPDGHGRGLHEHGRPGLRAQDPGPRASTSSWTAWWARTMGQFLPAGTTHDQAVAALRAMSPARWPTCSRPPTPSPASASTSAPWGRSCWCLAGAVRGHHHLLLDRLATRWPAWPSGRSTGCAATSTRSWPGCRSSTSTRTQRGDTLSRVTNDIDNIANTLQQSLTQILTSLATIIGVLAMMIWISPDAGGHLAAGDPGGGHRHDAHRPPLAEAIRRPVGAHRHAERPRRGVAHRPLHRQGLRPPGRRHPPLRRRERARSTRPASRPTSSPASSCRR